MWVTGVQTCALPISPPHADMAPNYQHGPGQPPIYVVPNATNSAGALSNASADSVQGPVVNISDDNTEVAPVAVPAQVNAVVDLVDADNGLAADLGAAEGLLPDVSVIGINATAPGGVEAPVAGLVVMNDSTAATGIVGSASAASAPAADVLSVAIADGDTAVLVPVATDILDDQIGRAHV